MQFTPLHMQIAGVVVIAAVAIGFLFWTARALLGMHDGYPVYVLPDPDHDDPGDGSPDHDVSDTDDSSDSGGGDHVVT